MLAPGRSVRRILLEAAQGGLATRRHARALLLEVRATRLLNRLLLLRGGLGHPGCRRRSRSRWLTTTTQRLLAPGRSVRRILLETAQGGLTTRRHACAVRLVICAARLLNRLLLLRRGLRHRSGSWRRGNRRGCRTASQRLLASWRGVRRVLLEATECGLTARRHTRAVRLVICATRLLDRSHLLLAGLLRYRQTRQPGERAGEQHVKRNAALQMLHFYPRFWLV